MDLTPFGTKILHLGITLPHTMFSILLEVYHHNISTNRLFKQISKLFIIFYDFFFFFFFLLCLNKSFLPFWPNYMYMLSRYIKITFNSIDRKLIYFTVYDVVFFFRLQFRQRSIFGYSTPTAKIYKSLGQQNNKKTKKMEIGQL